MISQALSALRSDTRRGRRWRWWGSVALFTLLVSVWSLATPLMAAPDEPAHVTKAAAVARLQFLGTAEPFKKATGVSPIITVHVPAAFGHRRPPCYSNHPDRPASCQPPILASSGRLVPATTYEGRFPPLYYFFAGLPTLVLHDAAAIRLMRLVSAFLAALFLASALESAFRCHRGSHMVLGVVVAATPMALFLAGTVNPSGLEIASAISLWSAGVCLLVEHGGGVERRLLARAGVAGAVLAQCRGLSLVWVALIGLCLLALAPAQRLRELLADSPTRVCAGVVVVSAGLALAWLVHFDSLALSPVGNALHESYLLRLDATLNRTPLMVREMIGYLGWLDTPPPVLTYMLWLAVVAGFLWLGLARGSRRVRVLLVSLVLLCIFVPAMIDAYSASRLGTTWQGRYTLPLSAGIGLVALSAVPARLFRDGRWRRGIVVVVVALALAQADLFLEALRRYTYGIGGPFFPFGGSWSPPLGAVGVTVLFVFALVAYSAWTAALAMPVSGPDDGGAETAAAGTSSSVLSRTA